jgi:hypothetical protein
VRELAMNTRPAARGTGPSSPQVRVRRRAVIVLLRVLVCSVVGSLALVAVGSTAAASRPAVYANCKALNGKYAHGLGRAGARDRVKGAGTPVTTFTRNTRLYNIAIKWNSRLDGDKDGVACEKS